jgi:transcription termination factor Rho
VKVAELLLERAKRLVEIGEDVIITSSGLSPTNKTNNLDSGLLVIIALAISLSNDVLPLVSW